MEKILHVNGDNYNLGGAFLITYRVEKYLRKYGFSYDYLSMDHFSENSKFPMPSDDKTYSANLRKNRLIGHILLPLYVNKILKNNSYRIMHIDTDSAWKALLYSIPAKKNKLKVVVHSHSTGIDGDYKIIKKIVERLSKRILPNFTDQYIACSSKALNWLVPNNCKRNVNVIFNGIDFEQFYYSKGDRESYRKKLNLGNKFIIGNIALFTKNKNQKFLIEVFKCIHQKDKNSILLLIGNYDTKYGHECIEYVKHNNMEDSVIFMGLQKNIRELLCVMDIFILPSFFEGAPLSLYEAQATGLLCFASNTLSNDAIISDWCYQLNLSDNAQIWANKILSINSNQKDSRINRKLNSRYSLNTMAVEEAKIYEKLKEKNDE